MSTHTDDLHWIELRCQGEVLRFPLTGNEFRLGRDRTWSSVEIPTQGWDVLSRRHAIFFKEGDVYRICDGDGHTPSHNGIFLNHRKITPTKGLRLQPGVQLEIGQNPHNLIQLLYSLRSNHPDHVLSSRANRVVLDLRTCAEQPILLGRVASARYASMVLDDPTVSRCHAIITKSPQGQYILEDTSTNGTFVNQMQIDQPVVLNEGDGIRIGPYLLLFRHNILEVADPGHSIRLDAHNLCRTVHHQKDVVVLNNISLSIEPGQLVALVGGSGAGKTTLLKTLLGLEPSDSGDVYLNGDHLRQNFNVYRHRIAYVPQDDIVHRNLTIEEVLTYACKMRLPDDIDLRQTIKQTLQQIRLNHVRTSLVRHLSGGQRKRVSIGVELLSNPRLFFLDEPTSGLDPGLDKEMMMLLRELADQGRTIILVTHATANIEVCDRVAFLGRGGTLCYFGPPQDATAFFGMPSNLKYFADIYLKLEQGNSDTAVREQAQYWSKQFHTSNVYQTYVEAPLSLGYESNPQKIAYQLDSTTKQSFLPQLTLLSQRQRILLWRDRFSLVLALIAAPLGISLIRLALGDQSPFEQLDSQEATQAPITLKVLFVFTCATVWVGLSSSIQEVVKEASIYIRERLVGLGLFAYLSSKILVRSLLAVIQTSLILIFVLTQFQFPDSNIINIPWAFGLGITTFLTLFSSVCLGVMLSTIVKNEYQASAILPLVLLPQIIFSGVLFNFDQFTLANPVGGIAWLTISRWSIAAYGSFINVNDMVPICDDVIDPCLIPHLFERTPVYNSDLTNLCLSWWLLCLHAAVYLGISLYQQSRKV